MKWEAAELVEKALSLPQEARAEVIEAILQGSGPTEAHIAGTMELVFERAEEVRAGRSPLIPAEAVLQEMRVLLSTN